MSILNQNGAKPALSKEAQDALNFMSRNDPKAVEYILAETVDEASFHKHKTLFRQDTPVEFLYLILEGRVREVCIEELEDGQARQTLTCERGPGSLLGIYDLIYREPHSTRARAIEPGRYVQIDAAAINRLIYRFPDLRYTIAPLEKISHLRTMPMLVEMTLTEVSFLADGANFKRFSVGQKIYDAGPTDEPMIYLIHEGQVELTWGDERAPLWLGNGSAFGFSDHRTALYTPDGHYYLDHNAEATCGVTLYMIPRRYFIQIAAVNPELLGRSMRQKFRKALRDLTVLQNFSNEELNRLAGFVSQYHISGHHLITRQGEIGDSMWVLMPGYTANLRALDRQGHSLPAAPVKGLSFFSEVSLVSQLPLESTIEAEPNSLWMRLHWIDFHAFLVKAGVDLIHKLRLSYPVASLLDDEGTRQQYSWLQDGELLIAFQHRHWVVLARRLLPVVLTFLAALIPIIVAPFFMALVSSWILLYLALLIIPTIAWVIWCVVDFQNDYLIVTNQRVVRQEKVVFISEWRQTAIIEQVQSIDSTTSFMGNMFGYGDLLIQTSSTHGALHFDYVPDPGELKQKILEQRDQYSLFHSADSKKVIHELLEERLGLKLQLPSRVWSKKEAVTDIHQSDKPWWQRIRYYLKEGRYLQKQELEARHLVWRKHWFVLLAKITTPVLIVLGCVLLGILLLIVPEFPYLPEISLALGIPIVLTALICLASIGWFYVDWYNDTYEVGPSQLIDIEKKPLFFAEQRRTAHLGEIEDIRLLIPSPIHYILNFGNVRLQTAAQNGEFTFDAVPDPRAVAEEIRRRIDAFHHGVLEQEARRRAQELPDWFEMYSRLGIENKRPAGIHRLGEQ